MGSTSMQYENEYELWLKKVTKSERAVLCGMRKAEIEDAFCKSLNFGTGGLRGIMGLGTNRMNIYTVSKATQGIADEINEMGNEAKERGVVIAYDSRNSSYEFALETAKVLSGNGIKTYLFESLRPTPELSFAVRYLNCIRGIVITASHNPKEYNGYKVYGEDGGQIPPDVADRIIKYIDEIDIFDDIKVSEENEFISIGKEVDEAYLAAVYKESLRTEIPNGFQIVYTPLHGAGNLLVRGILDKMGAKNVFVVPEQEEPNGDFPTVDSPNPENAEAFTLAIEYAQKYNADLIFGTDPDSDRIGVVVKTKDGDYKVLNGNQTGVLICEFLLKKLNKTANSKLTIVKTIVTTELAVKIASKYSIDIINVLTGFKYIGEKIKEFEMDNQREFLFGFEESYGYLKGTYCRDKDAVVAAMLITEMAAEYKKQGKNLYDALIDIYKSYGFYEQCLETVKLVGEAGKNKIEELMKYFRDDFKSDMVKQKIDYLNDATGLPKANVLKFIVSNGWFAVRPSGTEPKIKFYFETYSDSQQAAKELMAFLKENVMQRIEKIYF